MSVCTWIAQDRAHFTQVLSRWPLCIVFPGTLAAVRSTTLRTHPFVRYGLRCQFSWRQPGRQQRLKPYAYSYQTQEAQLKPDCRTEGRRNGSQTTSAYSFLPYTSSAYWTYIYTFPVFLLCYYSSFKFMKLLYGWVRGMCLRIVYALISMYVATYKHVISSPSVMCIMGLLCTALGLTCAHCTLLHVVRSLLCL